MSDDDETETSKVEPKNVKPVKKKQKGKYPRPTTKVDLYGNPVKKVVSQKCIWYNAPELVFPQFCKWSTKRRRCTIRKDWSKPIVLTKEGRCPYQRYRVVKRNIKKDKHDKM
jgi:hypothetical protein